VQPALAPDDRRVRLDRADLPSFLFAPDDGVIIVGQDGLVPNVAKYLDGQLTIGSNRDPDRYDGILCPHRPSDAPALLNWLDAHQPPDYRVEHWCMAVVEREDGQRL
jgi:hypothetical protein